MRRNELGELIRTARESNRHGGPGPRTQAELAEKTNRAAQQISQYERGAKLPTIEALVQINHALRGPEVTKSKATELAQWILAWVRDTVSQTGKDPEPLLASALQLLAVQADPTARSGKPWSDLADFPGDDPLTIIVSDRREWSAKSAADCFIYSGSMVDTMYLPQLLKRYPGDAVIKSDKLLARMPDEYLRELPELAGSNLLVVGSPASNWGARMLNDGAIFPFKIDQKVVKRTKNLLDDARMQDDAFASVFWKLARIARRATGDSDDGLDEDTVRRSGLDSEEERHLPAAAELARTMLDQTTARAIMNQFRSFGILDPADQALHGTFMHSANDFAVVSLAANPYCPSGRYRAIICGGIHGPGTAGAMRALADPRKHFKEHPLGAVLEIRIRRDLDWPTRFERTAISLQTEPYDPHAILERFQSTLARPVDERSAFFQDWDDEQLANTTEFLRSVLRTSAEIPLPRSHRASMT
jgi:transcriptional regulator with XRE-family HTH domain